MKGAKTILPIPIDHEIAALVRQGATVTGLKLADVMRQGLRHGVPAFVEQLRVAREDRAPACLDYLDKYPSANVPAQGYKAALRRKLAAKHTRANR